jgi:sigma-B regulation protein RsbU (phosphoserine phosphatase)
MLMKKVERAVAAIGETDDLLKTVHRLAEHLIAEFRDELGIYGGRLYQREEGSYVLRRTFGDAKPLAPGLRVPSTYPPLELCCLRGTAFMDADDPSLDPELETTLGVHEFACVEVGDEEYVLAFNVAPGFNREDILFSLGILRHAISQQIRHQRLQEVFREARKIQASLLPRKAPRYGSYDVYGRNESMKSVGGDYFDYISISPKILGVAIADVSGHGLPAALQVRDVYTGLRMGAERDFKMVRTIERLNRIIHSSTLTSRFVSLVYGELEVNGNFIYVNAGHPPPIHLKADGRHRWLREGGPVLGPLPEASYERGFVRFSPGDMLVLYTDGIVESYGDGDQDADEEFGSRRLLEVIRRHLGRSAREVVDAVFAGVEEFAAGRQVMDDRTVVVICFPERSSKPAAEEG